METYLISVTSLLFDQLIVLAHEKALNSRPDFILRQHG